MNNKAKIKMLRDMKPHIGIQKLGEHKGNYFGFCDILKFHFGVRHTMVEKKLDLLGLKRPKNAGLFWYPENKRGTATRIRKINQAIKRLQK